jgi:dephospho-CoA kinase
LQTPLLKVGLTGGIATGKSHVLRYFAELGAAVIDADRIAREVVRPGLPAHGEIVQAFGDEVLDKSGEIDRKALGVLVFSCPARLRRLNAILHPRILGAEDERVRELETGSPGRTHRMVVVDAALMIEVGSYRKYDQLVLVYCPPSTQLKRVVQRDGISEDQARERIATQLPLLRKVAYADYVIETSDEPSRTRAQVEFVYRDLLFRLDSGMLAVRSRL